MTFSPRGARTTFDGSSQDLELYSHLSDTEIIAQRQTNNHLSERNVVKVSRLTCLLNAHVCRLYSAAPVLHSCLNKFSNVSSMNDITTISRFEPGPNDPIHDESWVQYGACFYQFGVIWTRPK
jgi:hypothetical protein